MVDSGSRIEDMEASLARVQTALDHAQRVLEAADHAQKAAERTAAVLRTVVIVLAVGAVALSAATALRRLRS
jgi:hypothetical protein